ncbi:MAG TPA: hypothetical protein VFY01_04275 [Rheinheimera sp.]|nr:hypothetical protein [Rheinheimera sp.]
MTMIRILTAALLAMIVTACSDTPGEAKLAQLLQQRFDAQYDELIDVAAVKKINGWSDNDSHYTAEVSYTIEFKQSFKAYMDKQTAKPGNPLEKMASGMAAGMLKLQYGDFNTGDEYQVKQQTLTLRKTENGWVLTD